MSLRRVDKLVREEKYDQALKVLLEVRESQPNNPYLPAYEERLRSAIDIRARGAQQPSVDPAETPSALFGAAFPPVEEQFNAIARPVKPATDPKAEKRALEQKKREEQRRVALLSKIAALVGNANEFLQKGEFERALEEIARANMLDPSNEEIADLEERIRSAQEEAERVAEEQRRIEAQQEEEERARALQREREEALREADERRAREEEARRAAQEQKLNLCLRRSREFLGSGLLDEAQSELAFALVLQPDSQEASELEQELARRYEERRQAELARQREEEEERRREEERVRTAVAAAIREAEEASRRGDFVKALARITEGYIEDPGNPALATCEAAILAARDEWARKAKEEAQAREEARRTAREEEERKRQEEERKRVREERELQARAQQKEEEEQLWYHLRRARTLLSNGSHDQALAEVALAFVVNPFSEEVKRLEAEILLAQGAAAIQPASPSGDDEGQNPHEPSPPEGVTEEVRAILERATIHGTRKEFAQAFEEIARAYALAPMDATIAECEARIRSGFVTFQEELASSPVAAKRRPSGQGSERRSATGQSQRRRNRRGPQPAPPAAASSFRAAASGSGRGSRTLRLLMTAAALAAVSLSAAYLVNSDSTLPPATDTLEDQTQELLAQDASPRTVRQLPPPAPETPPREVTGGDLGTPMRSGGADRQAGSIALTEAGFSPVTGLSDMPGPALEQPAETTGTQAFGARDTTFDGLESDGDATSLVPADPVVEDSGDLYASTLLPGSSLTRAPQIVRLSRPQITDVGRRSETTEEITVMVEIGADGSPLQARVVQSTYPPYNHAVIDAVMRSEFQPGLTPSGPAAKWMTIPFRIKP